MTGGVEEVEWLHGMKGKGRAVELREVGQERAGLQEQHQEQQCMDDAGNSPGG